ARSDVYSLGIVLTELLTGERPTGGEPGPATDLERVVAKARAADPSARHQVAAELRDELRAVDAGAPAAPRPPTRTGAPITAVSVTVATDADSNATARATGAEATAVLPAATATVAVAGAVSSPTRTPDPAKKPRRFRRAKAEYPKLAKAPKPVKPMKPPKPTRRARKQARKQTVRP